MRLYRSDTYQDAQNNYYPCAVTIETVEDLTQAVTLDHVAAEYKGGRRKAENYIVSDCLMMDVDNAPEKGKPDIPPSEWIDLNKIRTDLPGVRFFAATSRSHMIEKNGRPPRPKYHIYFPMEPITDAEAYKAIKTNLQSRLPYFDTNAVDAARMFFGNKDAKVQYFPGDITIDKYLKQHHAVLPEQTTIKPTTYHTQDTGGLYGLHEVVWAIAPSRLSYSEWINVGMAMESKGLSVYEFDAWSRSDPRYKGFEDCNRHWRTFDGSKARSLGGTYLIDLAKSHGWRPPERIPPAVIRQQRASQSAHPTTHGTNLQETLKKLQPEISYTWDDKGMGGLFADIFKDVCRFNTTAKEWFYYNGKFWEIDTGGMRVSQKAKQLADALLVYCTGIEDDRQKSDYAKFVAKFGQLRYRETMVKDARDVHFISTPALDTKLEFFNCQNGTYDLNNGEFLPHRPDDLLSKISNVTYDPTARSPLFERFISDIMQGDKEKIDYL